MAEVLVKLFANFRERAKTKQLELKGNTIQDILDEFIVMYPDMRYVIYKKNNEKILNSYVNVLINGMNINQSGGLKTRLKDGDEIAMFPPVSGGSDRRMDVDTAKKIFLTSFSPVNSVEEINIEDADGRVLAEDLIAARNVPDYRRAAMDGYAVRAADTLGADRTSPVLLEPEDCVRVHTGSVVPGWADAVVMIEDTESSGDFIELFSEVHPNKNVGAVGEDITRGEKVLKKEHSLRPADIAAIASLGIDKISAYVKPKVAVIPTGEELVSRKRQEDLKEGKVIETNGLMTALYVRRWGGIPFINDTVRDDPRLIEEAIRSNLDKDMIILCGGTSAGKRDFVPDVVRSMGTLLVRGISMSPGKPTALGIIGETPVVCIPGYPVAGMVALEVFAKDACLKLGHMEKMPDRVIRGKLIEKIASKPGYRTYVRVTVENGLVRPLMTHGAGILSSVAKARGFVVVDENLEGYSEGDLVDVIIID